MRETGRPALNATITDTAAPGFATGLAMWSPQPLASKLNFDNSRDPEHGGGHYELGVGAIGDRLRCSAAFDALATAI